MEKRLQTVLAHAGVASRRKAASLIEEGKVRVDGRVVKEKGYRLDPDKSTIEVGGKTIEKERKRYFLFNKPRNVISTLIDTHGRRKVTDFFKSVDERLYPIGRLDKDTTGILILTNDGELAHRLSHPSFEVEKEYVAKVERPLTQEALKKMREGLVIDGKKTSPCGVFLRRREKTGVYYRIKLHEGRKRQIREMFRVVGSRVIELKRVKYASLTLKGVGEGEFRKLSPREVRMLQDKVKK